MSKMGAEFIHDLRLPLQVIYSCAQMLEAQGSGQPYTGMLMESVDEARRLVSDYLDLWREGQAPFKPIRGDLAALARRIAARWRLSMEERGVRLRFAANVETLELPFDPEYLGRAVQNLLANALRHAPKGSEVRVEVVARGDYVELCVRDDGPGLPQGEGTPDGYGLGLGIVRTCAALHGGELRVPSRPEGGAEFILRLPLPGTATAFGA